MSITLKENLTLILMNIPGAGGAATVVFGNIDFWLRLIVAGLTITVQIVTLRKLLKKKK